MLEMPKTREIEEKLNRPRGSVRAANERENVLMYFVFFFVVVVIDF